MIHTLRDCAAAPRIRRLLPGGPVCRRATTLSSKPDKPPPPSKTRRPPPAVQAKAVPSNDAARRLVAVAAKSKIHAKSRRRLSADRRCCGLVRWVPSKIHAKSRHRSSVEQAQPPPARQASPMPSHAPARQSIAGVFVWYGPCYRQAPCQARRPLLCPAAQSRARPVPSDRPARA